MIIFLLKLFFFIFFLKLLIFSKIFLNYIINSIWFHFIYFIFRFLNIFKKIQNYLNNIFILLSNRFLN